MRFSNLLVSGSTVTSINFYNVETSMYTYVFHDPFYGLCAYATMSSVFDDDEKEVGFSLYLDYHKLIGTRYGRLLERNIKRHITINERFYNNKKVIFRVHHKTDFNAFLKVEIKNL